MRGDFLRLLAFLAVSACGADAYEARVPDVPAGATTGTLDGGVSEGVASGCADSPWVRVSGAGNTRTLGGVPLADGGTVACGMLYRGTYLSLLTALGCDDFARLGIKTVIDLRMPSERIMPSACVVSQAAIAAAPMPIPYDVSPSDYLADLYASEAIVPAMSILAQPTAYPIYFHCRHGRDRSGVLAAVVLLALGASPEEVRREYRLSEVVGYGSYPDSLEAVLAEIELLGGIDAYFTRMGIPATQVESMRRLLKRPAQASPGDAL